MISFFVTFNLVYVSLKSSNFRKLRAPPSFANLEALALEAINRKENDNDDGFLLRYNMHVHHKPLTLHVQLSILPNSSQLLNFLLFDGQVILPYMK
jgi:hypothetical protein